MVNDVQLQSWIQPQHLNPKTLCDYREDFTAHPLRCLVISDFLLDSVIEKLNCFFEEEAILQQTYGLCSLKNQDISETQWQQASDHDRFYTYSIPTAVQPERRLSPNLLMFLKFRLAIAQSQFKPFFETVSGLPLGSNTLPRVRAIRQGDMLRPHDDRLGNRRLTCVLSLSKDWEPGFGGELRLKDWNDSIATIEAAYNSLVVFDVTAQKQHEVAPVLAAAGDRIRLSMGYWFQNPD